jgi:hypothetical protein
LELPHGAWFLGDAPAGRVCLILYRKFTYLEDKRWARAAPSQSRVPITMLQFKRALGKEGAIRARTG